jgi:hypothetical protein
MFNQPTKSFDHFNNYEFSERKLLSPQQIEIDENDSEMDQQPRLVRVMIEFTKLGEIDTLNERFQGVLTIESKWIETRDTEKTEYDPSKHWNPKLFIENAFQEPKETISYSVSRNSDNTLTITETREAKGNNYKLNFYFSINLII